MTTYTPDELAAWALDLSDAQQKMLSGFADGRSRMYVHFAVAEALRRRGYLNRSSWLIADSQWANHEGVRERTQQALIVAGRNFLALVGGREVAPECDEQQLEFLGLPIHPPRPAWRHEWDTTGKGWQLAKWLYEQAKAARA